MNSPTIRYFLTSDGYRIGFSVAGAGEPLVTVTLPYFNDMAVVAPPLSTWFEGLRSHFQLVEYDGRGQGSSTRGLPQRTSIRDFVRDIEELIDHLNLSRVALMAYGWSGHIAVHYAAKHPERVSALILFSTAINNAAWPPALLLTLAASNLDAFLLSMAGVVGTIQLREIVDAFRRSTSQADYLLRARILTSSTLEPVLPRLRTRTLVLCPRQFVLPPRNQ